MNNETRKIQSFTEKAIIILALIIPYFLFLIPEGADAAGLKKPPTNLGLVGYWSMNEGTGSYAGDSSGNKNTGTLTNGPTWVDGKRGKALNFDGSNDYVDAGNIGPPNTNGMSVAFWTNLDSLNGGWRGFVSKATGGGTNQFQYVIGFGSGSDTNIRIHTSDATTQYNNNCPVNIAGRAGEWIQIVAVWNTTSCTMYLNGVAKISQSTTLGMNTTTDFPLRIGTAYSASGYEIDGKIDEVRIYNRALSAAEVQALYKSGAAKRTQGPSNLGLVGYWSFDDGTTTVANDSSGNRNHGRLTNMDSATDWVPGKRGKALDFDGSNDYVTMGNITADDFGTGPMSVSVWFKTSSVGYQEPVDNKTAGTNLAGFNLYMNTGSNKMTFRIADGTNQRSISGITAVDNNQWHHAVGVRNGDTITIYIDGVQEGTATGVSAYNISNATTFFVGAYGTGAGQANWNGLIDDVRVYNRALSATEIQALYESTYRAVNVSQNNRLTDGLVGFWSFNGPDMSGVTAYDRSGNNNNGTLTNGPALTYGKVGQALSFDGVNDWIDNITQPAIQISPNIFTVVGMLNPGNQTSRFITPNSAGIDQYIQYDATNRRLDVGITEFADINNRLRSSTSGSMPIDTWTHWAVSINNKNIKIYINGVLNSEFNESIDIADWTGNWRIGQRGNSTFWYKGKLDEVRIYNRVLTPDEIKRLYNMGR